ncbi:MAG: MotA/TolQ/ExbB proton channel family protein [Lachnospiraceae bacterium]|nr:MotA/TolQ/ExbB proton channel family protein [Lachnospiraceae bacterium]
MKNKICYGLLFVYLVVVIFILYLNGVFTGEVTDMVNLIINGVFLIIIGILFAFSTISFARINLFTGELMAAAEQMQKEYKEAAGKSIWPVYQDKKDMFGMDALKTAYAKYRMRMKSYKTKRGYINSCDLEEYINEELLERVGMGHFNGAMSGTLTGLGILGTFLGLSIGLGSFNGNDIYAVTDNVGTLLGGMKVAFHTSVYGIFFSLIFSFMYRSLMADAYEKLERFLHVFRQCVVPPAASEDENYAAMLVYQANMASSMKQMLELMQGHAAEQTAGVERIVNQFVEQMSQTMGVNLQKLGGLLEANGKAQQMYAESSRELLQTAAALIEGNRANQEAAQVALERQNIFATQLQAQKEKIAQTCDEISTDISNQLYTFEQMRNLYES